MRISVDRCDCSYVLGKILNFTETLSMNFGLTMIYLKKATIFLLICLFAELQAEAVEKETHTDLTKTLQNPSKVLSLDLSSKGITTLPSEIGQLLN
ncbi:hypothetical protein LEP1GSC062_4462 [Leptospira alexanderi serovar Manhao 3 str. L 60]|uniref:Leucine rich repeat protein n=2 Tax=Leptospira alexanderi TaxID=100053 RepID=V6I2J6_9LEPT|nr:hypothetical protein LEP1GSC062_4462 [Leptospira alexanderi serovar Manhao 3 str. L 60]